jgi:hypothetical protein
VRGWINTPRDGDFAERCHDVGETDRLASARATAGIETRRIDEMTGVQALERAAPTQRARLSTAGPARACVALYMAAAVAIRDNPHVSACYTRLPSRGKAKRFALGAAMRKLVHLCFGVFKRRRPYQPDYASAA